MLNDYGARGNSRLDSLNIIQIRLPIGGILIVSIMNIMIISEFDCADCPTNVTSLKLCYSLSMSAQIHRNQIQLFKDATPSVMALRLEEQEVCSYWGIIFSPQGIATLTKQDMTGFMRYEQNRRWKDISKENVAEDLDCLKKALLILVDDTIPLADRLNDIEPGRGEHAVPFLGKAKLSAILLVTHPREYGVWNDYSERALRGMGLFPVFEDGWYLGEQYMAVNSVLQTLAKEYGLTMWWLDVILEKVARLVR